LVLTILRPTPPFLFAIPRRVIVLPVLGPLPHTEHTLDILDIPP
jgi:hypothetical protein